MTTCHIVGDLILDAPDPGAYFEPSREALSADLLIGHVEIPHTLGGEEISTDVAAPPCDPARLAALGEVGFDVATLAGNHIADRGAAGVRDTIEALERQGIATCGAGLDLAAAERPAIVERDGRAIGVISVNCVGPDVSKATSAKPGAAYLDVRTVYGIPFGGPGGAPMTVDTFADRAQLARLCERVAELRDRVDVVIVSLHKGVLHRPAVVADYEREIAHAVVDAGCGAVVSQHAHILKGIEVYRGRPIFHGLGNFVTVTAAIADRDENSPERRAWARKRRAMTGFDPDPAMPLYPFHPESRNTMIARVGFGADGVSAGFVPCRIDERARPVPVGGEAGERVVDYVTEISREAGFDTRFSWNGVLATVEGVR